jgi:hypothetical protein
MIHHPAGLLHQIQPPLQAWLPAEANGLQPKGVRRQRRFRLVGPVRRNGAI